MVNLYLDRTDSLHRCIDRLDGADDSLECVGNARRTIVPTGETTAAAELDYLDFVGEVI